jgi:hypothetical protein
MEEVSRTTVLNSQSLELSRPSMLVETEVDMKRTDHAHSNAKEPEATRVSSVCTSSSEQKWHEGSHKSLLDGKEEICMDLNRRRCCRCHKRRALLRQGVPMRRSSCTTRTRRCYGLAVTAAREAVKVLAVEELGVLDRVAASLTEWMQVIAH